jgi:hypothetical protein
MEREKRKEKREKALLPWAGALPVGFRSERSEIKSSNATGETIFGE